MRTLDTFTYHEHPSTSYTVRVRENGIVAWVAHVTADTITWHAQPSGEHIPSEDDIEVDTFVHSLLKDSAAGESQEVNAIKTIEISYLYEVPQS